MSYRDMVDLMRFETRALPGGMREVRIVIPDASGEVYQPDIALAGLDAHRRTLKHALAFAGGLVCNSGIADQRFMDFMYKCMRTLTEAAEVAYGADSPVGIIKVTLSGPVARDDLPGGDVN